MNIKEKIIAEIKKIYDPEIPVNIYELGLIYDIKIEKDNNVKINMTLTSPNCPVAESLPKEVKHSIMAIKEVKNVDSLSWTPSSTDGINSMAEGLRDSIRIRIKSTNGKETDMSGW